MAFRFRSITYQKNNIYGRDREVNINRLIGKALPDGGERADTEQAQARGVHESDR